jgi:hypothetical protein
MDAPFELSPVLIGRLYRATQATQRRLPPQLRRQLHRGLGDRTVQARRRLGPHVGGRHAIQIGLDLVQARAEPYRVIAFEA